MKKNYCKSHLLRIIMRTTLFYFLISYAFCSLSLALPSYSQVNLKQRVTLIKHNVSLKNVLKDIESQANIKFVYSPSSININQKVNVNAKNKRVDLVLKEILIPARLRYIVAEDRIVLKETDNSSFIQ